ncbi:unnamed protein product [Acanthoscelides obtectus]|uniref:Uncharacterized protein n=1 Tax=Acanthoscelides obtectus TaxID=200917 RepID=A0A9P0KLA0_ACAOB|nr:unnamed protein product [Acanthoscelides obtectus]CAK1677354.1 hypothetical protein AOBTE_LOCUS31263 [Acanthoscelides obtectus]
MAVPPDLTGDQGANARFAPDWRIAVELTAAGSSTIAVYGCCCLSPIQLVAASGIRRAVEICRKVNDKTQCGMITYRTLSVFWLKLTPPGDTPTFGEPNVRLGRLCPRLPMVSNGSSPSHLDDATAALILPGEVKIFAPTNAVFTHPAMIALEAGRTWARQTRARLGVSLGSSITINLSTKYGCLTTLIITPPPSTPPLPLPLPAPLPLVFFAEEGLQINSISVSRKQCTSIWKEKSIFDVANRASEYIYIHVFEESYVEMVTIDVPARVVRCGAHTVKELSRDPGYESLLGKSNIDTIIYSPKSFDAHITVRPQILFLHALTGCYTSALFNKGKAKATKIFQKRADIRDSAKVFNEEGCSPDTIFTNGIKSLLAIYGAPPREESLDHHRYKCFAKSTRKSTEFYNALPISYKGHALTFIKSRLQGEPAEFTEQTNPITIEHLSAILTTRFKDYQTEENLTRQLFDIHSQTKLTPFDLLYGHREPLQTYEEFQKQQSERRKELADKIYNKTLQTTVKRNESSKPSKIPVLKGPIYMTLLDVQRIYPNIKSTKPTIKMEPKFR